MYQASMVDRTAHTVHQLLENLITQHMYNSIVSFTRPISICLRIKIIIKLKQFKAKATFGKSCYTHSEFQGKENWNRWNQACTLNSIVNGIIGEKSATPSQILILQFSVTSGVKWSYFLDTTSITLYTWLLTLSFVEIFVCY